MTAEISNDPFPRGKVSTRAKLILPTNQIIP